MSLFLNLISVAEAIEKISGLETPLTAEWVPIIHSYGRVIAEFIKNDSDIPGFFRSTVDGYAVIASDTQGSSESIPSMLQLSDRLDIGKSPDVKCFPGTCQYIPTGGVLPEGADAVVMIEYAQESGDMILINRPVAPGENVIGPGEDFRKDDIIFGPGRRISPQDLGVLAAAGIVTVPVIKQPKIGIISTGDELIPASENPKRGQVRDVNSYVCGGFILENGGIPVYYGIIPDKMDRLSEVINLAIAENDLVFISGGSSKGEKDMTKLVIEKYGRVIIHGIAISPGKPTIFGVINNKPIIGLPGHPASAYIVLFIIVRHLLLKIQGLSQVFNTKRCKLATNVPSQRGREDYVRVRLENNIAFPLFGKSGLLNTLIKSQGIVMVPEGSEGFEAGCEVDVILW